MENFDIEKLDREMPYNLPEKTFENMQINVLAKTLNKKQAPIFNLKWLYAAAAVILMVIGVNFIIKGSFKRDISGNAALTAKNTTLPQVNSSAQTFVNQANDEAQSTQDLADTDISDPSVLTSTAVSHLTAKKQTVVNADLTSSVNKKTNPPTEAQIDNVLDGFSSSEIASLSNNTEQDVYLDLYN